MLDAPALPTHMAIVAASLYTYSENTEHHGRGIIISHLVVAVSPQRTHQAMFCTGWTVSRMASSLLVGN